MLFHIRYFSSVDYPESNTKFIKLLKPLVDTIWDDSIWINFFLEVNYPSESVRDALINLKPDLFNKKTTYRNCLGYRPIITNDNPEDKTIHSGTKFHIKSPHIWRVLAQNY